MKPLLIVWHSRTGAARQMAEAAADGAAAAAAELAPEAGFAVTLKRAANAGVDDLLASGGFLFCAPENLASLSGEMKEFFDRCYYGALDRIQGLPYACAISAGSDGAGAADRTHLHGLAPARGGAGLIVNLGAQTPAQIAAPRPCRRLIWSAARNWADCWPD